MIKVFQSEKTHVGGTITVTLIEGLESIHGTKEKQHTKKGAIP